MNAHDTNHYPEKKCWLDEKSIIPWVNWNTLFLDILALIGAWSCIDINWDAVFGLRPPL